ncbi:MAG: YicC family protein [Thermodesulfovibrionales bacterium]
MIQSMTGFGSAEGGVFRVEIRSVNHRFMDISIKIPPNLGQHEMKMRGMLKERFFRGRFDVLVSTTGEENISVRVNKDAARSIYGALSSLKNELSLPGEIGIETISRFSELILTEGVEYDTESLYTAFGDALSRLLKMRLREGEAIAGDIASRLEVLKKLNDRVGALCPEVADASRERLIKRLNDLLGEGRYDKDRILQEAVIAAERVDITEEITRIDSHITQMRKILSDGDTIGRKMEFILQELNREVNTIASKTDDYRVSSIAIEMKAEIEKMREQAQNIQ